MSTQVTTSSNAKVVCWGNEIGVAYTSDSVAIAAADSLPQTATFTRDGDEQEIRDNDGEVITFVTYNLRETLDIEVIPVGDSAANAAANNIAPAKGTLVTITDTSSGDNTRIAGGTSGNEKKYICISSTQTNSNTSEVRISMSLRRYAADVATAGT